MPNKVICHVTLDKVHVLILSNKKMAHNGAQFDISLVSSELESIQRLTGDLLYSRFQEICSDRQPGEDLIAKLNTSYVMMVPLSPHLFHKSPYLFHT